METTTVKTERSIDPLLEELESITEEIRLQLHLAGMEANGTWTKELEPRIFAARVLARDAGKASKTLIDEMVAALRNFQKTI